MSIHKEARKYVEQKNSIRDVYILEKMNFKALLQTKLKSY